MPWTGSPTCQARRIRVVSMVYRLRDREYEVVQDGPGRGEVEPRVPGAAEAERRARAQRRPGGGEEVLGRVDGRRAPAEVQPGQIGSLGHPVPHVRRPAVQQVREQPPVAVEVADDVGEPTGAVVVGGDGGGEPDRAEPPGA